MKDHDPLALALLLAIFILLLRRDEPPAPKAKPARITKGDPQCPYCSFVSFAETPQNISRSVNAHIRQIHPMEWHRHLVYGADRTEYD